MLIALLQDNFLAVTVGLSVACIVAFILWPRFGRNAVVDRIGVALNEGVRPQVGRRAEATRAQFGIRAVVGRLVGKIALPTEQLSRSLLMAGIRGPDAVMTYALAKVGLAALIGPACYLYLRYMSGMGLPQSQNILAGMVGACVGYMLPAMLLKNRIIKRQLAIQRAWPNALDLMLICVESGMGIDQSMRKVSEEIGLESVDLAEELTLTVAELSYLPDRRQAFENLSIRTGLDAVKSVVAALKQAERHGTSLGASLRILSHENRDLRLSLAEKKAAALPPKLTVPMILFFLPVLFAVIIAPAVMKIMSAD